MNTLQKPAAAGESHLKRFGRKFLKVGLFLLLSGITLIGLLYALENFRGYRAVSAYLRDTNAPGVSPKGAFVTLLDLAPPPIPDDQNFAMTPFLAPLYDLKPGTQQARDTNAFQRTTSWGSDRVDNNLSAGDWHMGQKTDWRAWQRDLLKAKHVPDHVRQAIEALPSPGPEPNKEVPLFERLKNPPEPMPVRDEEKMAAIVLDYLRELDPVVEELRAASQRPGCRFHLHYGLENPFNMLLPHLSLLKRVVRVTSIRASAELSLGLTDRAFEDVMLGLYMVDVSRDELTLISHLVRYAEMKIILQPVWEGLVRRQWSPAQMEAIQKRLQSFAFLKEAQYALDGERAGANKIMIHLRHNPAMLATLYDVEGKNSSLVTGIAHLLPRGWFQLEQINYNRELTRLFRGFDAAAQSLRPSELARSQQDFEKAMGNTVKIMLEHRVMQGLMLPALGRFLTRAAQTQTFANLAAIAFALERYRLVEGRLPDSLEALKPGYLEALPKDWITGETYPYRRDNDQRFALYSVGWNEKDDRGELGWNEKKTKVETTQGDWPWTVPAQP